MNSKIIADSFIVICFIPKTNPFEKASFEDKQHQICFLTSFNQEKFRWKDKKEEDFYFANENLLFNPNLGLTKILEKTILLPVFIDVVLESCKNSKFLIIESAFCHSNVELDMPNEQRC